MSLAKLSLGVRSLEKLDLPIFTTGWAAGGEHKYVLLSSVILISPRSDGERMSLGVKHPLIEVQLMFVTKQEVKVF